MKLSSADNLLQNSLVHNATHIKSELTALEFDYAARNVRELKL